MTLISKEFDDVYFSKDNGLEETDYVFLRGNGLPDHWAGKPVYRIFETGFGTGLNIMRAARLFDETSTPDQRLDLISVEKFPLDRAEIAEALRQWRPVLDPYLTTLLHQYPLRVVGIHPIDITPRIRLTLCFGDINDILPDCPDDRPIDAWFLDGFAPAKNPQMWTDTLFSNMARLSHRDTRFATFTAAGIVKRGLAAHGFTVEKSAGYGRKRDMLTGHMGAHARPRPATSTSISANTNANRTLIIGGGLAGTSALWRLRRAGLDATLYERAPSLADGASGNPLGLVNPKLTAKQHPHSLYYTSAYALFLRDIALPQQKGGDGALNIRRCGSLHLELDDDKARRFEGYCANLGWHSDHMRRLTSAEAEGIAGIPLPYAALYFPDSITISPAALCHAYAQGHAEHIRLNTAIGGLERTANGWAITDESGQVIDEAARVILANADGIKNLAAPLIPAPLIPDGIIHTVRGQISLAARQERLAPLKTSLCFGGYLSAYNQSLGGHILGASFKQWDDSIDLKAEDDRMNIDRFDQAIPNILAAEGVTPLRAAMRLSSKDRFPIIGADSRHDGLYYSLAHGSHGLISSAYASMLICADIEGRYIPTYQSISKACLINRFIKEK